MTHGGLPWLFFWRAFAVAALLSSLVGPSPAGAASSPAGALRPAPSTDHLHAPTPQWDDSIDFPSMSPIENINQIHILLQRPPRRTAETASM